MLRVEARDRQLLIDPLFKKGSLRFWGTVTALAALAGAVFAVMLAPPERIPVRAAMSELTWLLAGWGLFGLLLLGIGLGLSVWFKRNPVKSIILASMCVVAGMWLERWNIIVPTLTHPRLIAPWSYAPTLTEISLLAASFALLGLLFLIFFKLFPVLPIWDVAEGWAVDEAEARITIPAPVPATPARTPHRGFG